MSLSPRQKQICAAIAQGKRDKEIASDLHISRHTVGEHIKRIYTRIGVRSRTEAAVYYATRCPALA